MIARGITDGGRAVRMKLFIKDKSPFSFWSTFQSRLEDEVNAWLADNPGIRIVHVTQSSNGGSLDSSKIWLTIWYDDGGCAFPSAGESAAAPAGPPSQGISPPGR